MTLFIADDSVVVVKALKGLLSEIDGLDIVGEAGSVAEAIAGIQSLRPDVVLLDLLMPGGTGIDVLTAVKKSNPAPVVIMLTNHAYSQVRERCLKAGADAFFDKANEFEDAARMLRRLMS
ncbi:MAG: response regulator transcription factor [Acidobacteria bacterium]|nr:response regulator transcription factor [Acidobacteriota bacterium]